ncbi:MAG: LPS export ABC transporter permease LptF [Pseudomonadota bacterium]
MPRIDRYLLSQFLQLFGFFALVLVGVYWMNKAVGLFDQLIGDGQSALIFLEFSLLTLPFVIKLVLPVAAFIATIYVTNRMMSESELVVMQATGFSAFRLARPVLYFGLVVGVMMAILGNFIVPVSRSALEQARATMSENVTARYLTAGSFTHPTPNVTLYIRDISPQGELLDLFLADNRTPEARTTYTARSALFARGESGPKLIMFNGMVQGLDRTSQRLAVTRFADFTFDLGALMGSHDPYRRSAAELSTAELLWPSAKILAETGAGAERLAFEAHSRFSDPLLAVCVTLIGFGALVLGGFSRFGLWRQVVLAIAALIVVQGLNTAAADWGAKAAGGWALAYLAPALGLGLAWGLLRLAGANRTGQRRAP